MFAALSERWQVRMLLLLLLLTPSPSLWPPPAKPAHTSKSEQRECATHLAVEEKEQTKQGKLK